jgi:hypothetical protein
VDTTAWGMEFSIHGERHLHERADSMHHIEGSHWIRPWWPAWPWTCRGGSSHPSHHQPTAPHAPPPQRTHTHNTPAHDAACPPKYRQEVQSVFPGVDTTDLLIVPTCQRADMDLVQTGEKTDTEKDRLLERVGGAVAAARRGGCSSISSMCRRVAAICHNLDRAGRCLGSAGPKDPCTACADAVHASPCACAPRSSFCGPNQCATRSSPRATGRTTSTPARDCRCAAAPRLPGPPACLPAQGAGAMLRRCAPRSAAPRFRRPPPAAVLGLERRASNMPPAASTPLAQPPR